MNEAVGPIHSRHLRPPRPSATSARRSHPSRSFRSTFHSPAAAPRGRCRSSLIQNVARLCGFLLSAGALATAAAPLSLRDATASSGIGFVHTDGSSGRRYIMETIASGLGLIDYDGDGFLDIYFLNGAPLPGTPTPATRPVNALYRNNRDGTFTDVTSSSGTGDPGYALGIAVADYDNDGDEDLYVTNYGPNRLLPRISVCISGSAAIP